MTTADDVLQLEVELFRDLLPRVRDFTEIKAVLYVAFLSARDGRPVVLLKSLMRPETLRDVAGSESPEPAESRVRAGLDRAVANGVLLRIIQRQGNDVEVGFLLATANNRELVERLRGNDPEAAEALGVADESEVSIFRPNVFALYERAIGPLTPLVAEHLRDAERSYPRGWIEQAMDEAVLYNRRNWRYIEAILARWEMTGGPDGVSGRRS
jgi:DnaD/phage-associated family protein